MADLNIQLGLRGQQTIRLGVDVSTGHGCWSPVPAVSGSIDVFTDQIAECRVSDVYAVHCCTPGCHAPMVTRGARITFTNQLATHRAGDPLSCGDTSSNGSITTYAGN